MKNADLAKTIRYMIDAEKKALSAGKNRKDAIRAARDAFYKGEPARAMDKTFRELDGLMRYEDLANYQGKWMAPLHTQYRGYDVYSPSGWSQGPRMILVLNVLETLRSEVARLHDAEYIHIMSQAINLALSDSHKWVGDPDFVKMPDQSLGETIREAARGVDRSQSRVPGHAAVGRPRADARPRTGFSHTFAAPPGKRRQDPRRPA